MLYAQIGIMIYQCQAYFLANLRFLLPSCLIVLFIGTTHPVLGQSNLTPYELLQQADSIQSTDRNLALEVTQQALDLAQKQGIDSAICRANYALASRYRLIGKTDLALIAFDDFFQTCGTRYPKLYALAKIRMARAYGRTSNYEKSRSILQEIIPLVEQLDDPDVSFSHSQALSSYYHFRNELDSFRLNAKKTLAIALHNKDSSQISTAYTTLGVSFTVNTTLDSALYYNQKAYQIAQLMGKKSLIMYGSTNLGATYRNMGNLDSALHYLRAAERISGEIQDMDFKLATGYNISYTYADLGDFKNAFEKYRNTNILQDSLLGANHVTDLNELEVRYETVKKETEIEALKTENRINALQRNIWIMLTIAFVLLALGIFYILRLRTINNGKLEQVNDNKTKLFAIVSHDLRNMITSFDGMGEIAKSYVETKQYDRFNRIVDMLDSSSRKLHLFLDNLLKWSIGEMDRTPYHPENLSVDQSIYQTISFLQPLLDQKQLSINFSPQKATVFADPYALALIVRNVLNNAIKFSPIGSSIEIQVLKDPTNTTIGIRNVGSGISKEMIQKILSGDNQYSQEGTSNESGTGIGLFLVLNFLILNKGKMGIHSDHSTFTEFKLTLPNA